MWEMMAAEDARGYGIQRWLSSTLKDAIPTLALVSFIKYKQHFV
jgi:hypothetical protein